MSYVARPPPPQGDGYRRLLTGDPAPWFEQASSRDSRFQLDLAAGRYVVLCFFISAADPPGQRALAFVKAHSEVFVDDKFAFCGVSIDWRDEKRARESLPGVRFQWDFDLSVSRQYGAVPVDAGPALLNARRFWCILDPTLRFFTTMPRNDFCGRPPRRSSALRYLCVLPAPGYHDQPKNENRRCAAAAA